MGGGAAVAWPRLERRAGVASRGSRVLAEETPVAFTYGGSTHAVMMASPCDLEDFAVGFSLAEGIVDDAAQIEALEIVELEEGVDLQMRLSPEKAEGVSLRRRAMAGPVGCGLCGVESISQAMRAVLPVTAPVTLGQAAIRPAFDLLSRFQALNAQTRAVHAAGYFEPAGGLLLLREDVGRHNALDKLAGGLARRRIGAQGGAVLLTSRVSVEMVQKTARMGCGIILAVSAPTALAVRVAEAANITLVAVVRGEDHEIFTHPGRITTGERADVA